MDANGYIGSISAALSGSGRSAGSFPETAAGNRAKGYIYKLNILYTSHLRANGRHVKWDQNLVNASLEI